MTFDHYIYANKPRNNMCGGYKPCYTTSLEHWAVEEEEGGKITKLTYLGRPELILFSGFLVMFTLNGT